MLFHLKNSTYQAHLIAFEEKVSNFDTRYFGFIKIGTYRTWAYFTKTQVDYLKTLMNFTEESEGLKNYTSGVHFNKIKAVENKFYLNTFLFNWVSRFSERELKNLDSKYLPTYLFSHWKEHSFYSWFLSDREEVVFKEKVHFPLSKIKKFSFSHSDGMEKFSSFKNMNELCAALIPEGADASFFKEFKGFFLRHKFSFRHGYYGINIKLINTCLFLRKNFKFSEVKNFKTYHKLISFTFANFSCFKDYVMNESNLKEWEYCFKTLEGKSKVKTYLGWRFYDGRIKEMASVLKKLEPLNLPFNKHDCPQYAFNFYSKRYAGSEVKDFILPNENKYYEETYSKDLSQLSLKGFKAELVRTWRELERIGVQLHNCAGNFEKVDEYRKDFNFSLKNLEGEVKYLGTIRRGELMQLKGFKNSAPPLELYQDLSRQMKEQGIIRRADSFKESCIQKYR